MPHALIIPDHPKYIASVGKRHAPRAPSVDGRLLSLCARGCSMYASLPHRLLKQILTPSPRKSRVVRPLLGDKAACLMLLWQFRQLFGRPWVLLGRICPRGDAPLHGESSGWRHLRNNPRRRCETDEVSHRPRRGDARIGGSSSSAYLRHGNAVIGC